MAVGVFQLTGNVENFSLRKDSDGEDWEFSDSLISERLPKTWDADILVALVKLSPLKRRVVIRDFVDNNKIGSYLSPKLKTS